VFDDKSQLVQAGVPRYSIPGQCDRSVACIGSPATQKRSVLSKLDPDYAIPDLSLQLPTLALASFCASTQVPQRELNFNKEKLRHTHSLLPFLASENTSPLSVYSSPAPESHGESWLERCFRVRPLCVIMDDLRGRRRPTTTFALRH
jgi:hypothetical protein